MSFFLQNLPHASPPSRYSKFFEDALQYMGTSSGQVSKQETIASSSTSTFLTWQCFFGGFNLYHSSQSSGLLKCLVFLMRSHFAKLLRFCKIAPTLVQKKETPTQCKAFQKRIAAEFKDKEKQLFSETTPAATKKSMKGLPIFFLPSLPIPYGITDIQSCCCFACGCSLVVCSRETSYTTGTYLSMPVPLHGKDSTQ